MIPTKEMFDHLFAENNRSLRLWKEVEERGWKRLVPRSDGAYIVTPSGMHIPAWDNDKIEYALRRE